MIAVFRSRTQLFSFVNEMRTFSVSVRVVSTPQEVGVGCGLSASFDEGRLSLARSVVSGGGFVGFYRVLSSKRIVKIL